MELLASPILHLAAGAAVLPGVSGSVGAGHPRDAAVSSSPTRRAAGVDITRG